MIHVEDHAAHCRMAREIIIIINTTTTAAAAINNNITKYSYYQVPGMNTTYCDYYY